MREKLEKKIQETAERKTLGERILETVLGFSFVGGAFAVILTLRPTDWKVMAMLIAMATLGAFVISPRPVVGFLKTAREFVTGIRQ